LEEIVAYLDGELSAEESARVERRLAADESYRRELQGVERAWKALEELPRAIVDDKFSRTTMEMAVQAAADEVHERTVALPVQRRRRWLSTALAATAAAALGFLVVRLASPNPERMLLADLPVIDNVDVYTQFEQPDFLRMLRREFGDDFEELGGKTADWQERAKRMATVADVSQRDAWLAGLSPEERTNLRAKFNRFRELPPDEQQRLRELHKEIAAAEDAPQLKQAMLVYHAWLGGLPPARQFELREMPAQERLGAVKNLSREMRDDAMFTLSEEELKQFVRRMRGPVEELMRAAAKDFGGKEMPRGGGDRRANRFSPPPAMGRVLAMQFAAGVARPGKFQQALIEALPERTHDAFEALPPREKVERLQTWMRQAEAQRGEVSQAELERFFAEDLDVESRAELLSLPPGEMQQALRRLYRRQPGQGFGAPWTWGWRDGRGGRGPGGPGRPDWDDRRPPDRDRPGRGRPGEEFGRGGERGFGPPPPDGFGPREERDGPRSFERPPRRPPPDEPPPPRD
jgi:hypothetical protein